MTQISARYRTLERRKYSSAYNGCYDFELLCDGEHSICHRLTSEIRHRAVNGNEQTDMVRSQTFGQSNTPQ